MEIFLGLLSGLYVAVSLLLVIVGVLVLSLGEQYYTMECVLTDKRDFIGCIFGFQMFVWDVAKEYNINIFGAILMEIFITAFAIYYNILSFVVLTTCFVIKYFCKEFVFLFRKRSNRRTWYYKARCN